MGIVYTESPRLYGCGSMNIESFSIGRSNDGDVWPEISFIPHEGGNRPYASCCGRIRTPLIGGGASPQVFSALLRILSHMEADVARLGHGEQGDLFICHARPHRRRKYVERHLDDGHGYLGIEVQDGGKVRLHMRPEAGDVYSLSEPVDIIIGPETAYVATYAALPRLWKAIVKDNAALGAHRGFHAY